MSAALDPLPVACFALQERPPGADLLCTALNSRACQLLGLAPDQPAPDGLALLEALVAPAERAGFRRSWQQARAAREPFHWEGPLRQQAPHQWLRVLLEPGEQGRWHGVLIDLSRLKQELLTTRRILDNVPIAIAISGLDGDDPPITLLNAEFQRCFGWGEAELQRLSDWAERAYPDPSYRQAVISQWLAAVERARRQEGAVAGMEFQVHTATGERRDVLFSGRVIGQELLVTLLDVSERRQAQAELLQARDDLARTALEVTEAIPVGTYTMVLRPGSPLASFSFISERFLELTGLERQEALDDPLKAFACVHPDDYDAWVQSNAEVFAKKLPFFGQTRVVVNGEVRWITAESVPRDLPDGTTVWEGVLIDVTERIEAQQQLERSQERLERILNNIPVAIAINSLDPEDPEITFLN
ncbi:MAG: PAS domain S-box protein, partial [Cyanobacteriota bacterium]|nr:PAS domain S-box protein [Cyanobacteriota bacterium]